MFGCWDFHILAPPPDGTLEGGFRRGRWMEGRSMGGAAPRDGLMLQKQIRLSVMSCLLNVMAKKYDRFFMFFSVTDVHH